MVLSADDYQRLQRSAAQPDPAGPFCLEWLLELPPAAPDRSRDAIDTDLTNSATGDGLSTAVMVTGDATFQKVPALAVALVQGGDLVAA